MSIKSLFQNIANAIKIKDTSIVSITPSEMPDAILNIPSGGGVYYDMIDYLKLIPYVIASNVNTNIIGNQFRLSEAKKLRGVYVFVRSSITITITLYDITNNAIISTTTGNVTANTTTFIALNGDLMANHDYAVFATSPVNGVFNYASHAPVSLLNNIFTFVYGRYGSIPGNTNGDWMFSIIPSVE